MQRVSRARVLVDGIVVGEIGPGLCCLIGVTHDDDLSNALKLASKLWHLRIFADDKGYMNLSVANTSRELLVVSQFTLCGDARKGRRPSFVAAARPTHAETLFKEVTAELRRLGASVSTGQFGADMAVELTNDGPVTLMVEV